MAEPRRPPGLTDRQWRYVLEGPGLDDVMEGNDPGPSKDARGEDGGGGRGRQGGRASEFRRVASWLGNLAMAAVKLDIRDLAGVVSGFVGRPPALAGISMEVATRIDPGAIGGAASPSAGIEGRGLALEAGHLDAGSPTNQVANSHDAVDDSPFRH